MDEVWSERKPLHFIEKKNVSEYKMSLSLEHSKKRNLRSLSASQFVSCSDIPDVFSIIAQDEIKINIPRRCGLRKFTVGINGLEFIQSKKDEKDRAGTG